MFQSSNMFWNQCTYEWYNSPTKYIWFTELCSIFAIPTKGLKNITFNDNCPWNFTQTKKEPLKKIPSKFSIFF